MKKDKKEVKFKIGDKVRQKKGSEFYHQSKEQVGVIKSGNPGDWMEVEWSGGDTNSYAAKHLEKVNKKDLKKKNPKFLLRYELDEDPIEEFENLAGVKKRILELVETESSLDRGSIVVYEVKSTRRIEVKTTTEVVGL